MYSKPRISRIQVDRQIYPSYAKIQLMRSEIKRFGTIVREILSEICEDPTYARFTVFDNLCIHSPVNHVISRDLLVIHVISRDLQSVHILTSKSRDIT